MILFWQGWGILTVLIPCLVFIAIGFLAMLLGNYIDLEAFWKYFLAISLTLTAVVLWLVGKKLNGLPGQILVDPKTQEEVEIKTKHTLFWIPMHWYAIPVAILAIVALGLSLVTVEPTSKTIEDQQSITQSQQ